MKKIIITKEMLEDCAIPESKNGVEITWEDTGDTFYEDETYIGWNGVCVKKGSNKEEK